MGFILRPIVVFLPLLTICFGKFVPENHPAWQLLDERSCGLTIRDRIIGGREAKLGEYPWLVQVGTIGRTLFGKIELFYCGGVIVAPKYIVSAAHCIPNQNKRAMNAVRAGEHDLKSNIDCSSSGDECAPPSQVRRIVKITIHPDYDNPKTQNDIIVILMDFPLEYNDYVRHICMIPSGLMDETYSGMAAQVAGWGIYNLDVKTQSNVLNVVTLRVMGNEECIPMFEKYLNITKNQMCVGGEIGKDSCSGDSGGPLMKTFTIDGPPRTYLIGVVSLGFTKCAATPNPGIYTRVSEFEEWILDHILELENESRGYMQ